MQNQKTSKAQADNVELLMTAATALTSLTGKAQTQSQSQTQNANAMNTMQSLPASKTNAPAPVPAPRRTSTSTRKKAIRFPVKLMQMLSAGQFEHIISWTPDGLSFVVKKPSLLVDEVLPLYFKEVKYTSFTRKLHRWGFVKILRGKELSAYLHKNFQRGNLRLCEQMHCSKTSGLTSSHVCGAVTSASTAAHEVSRSSANRPIKNAPTTAEKAIIAGAISTARRNAIHQVDDGEMYGQEQEQHLLQMHERLRQQQAAMSVVSLPPAPPTQNRQQLFNMSQILMQQQQQEEQQRRNREQALMQQRAQIQMQMQLANELANGLNAPPQMAAHGYDFVRARHAMQHQRIIENAWNVLSQEQNKGNLSFSPSDQGQNKVLRNINMNYPPSA